MFYLTNDRKDQSQRSYCTHCFSVAPRIPTLPKPNKTKRVSSKPERTVSCPACDLSPALKPLRKTEQEHSSSAVWRNSARNHSEFKEEDMTLCKYSLLPKASLRAGIQTWHSGGESGPSKSGLCFLLLC